jgi:hypothetical protein
VEGIVEGVEGREGIESSTATRALEARVARGGPSLGAGVQFRVREEVTHDVVSKPLLSAGSPPGYGFSITYMGTSDQSRRGQGLRVETGDAPAYSTIQPISPDVSEDTVLPELQSGSTSF